LNKSGSYANASKKKPLTRRLKMPHTKNYYPRPLFPDIQFEERYLFIAGSYLGNDLTEWNIDGMSEHQIINTLHEMGIAVTTLKLAKTADTDYTAALCLISSFTGVLKGVVG
jgi:hypothetical protein